MQFTVTGIVLSRHLFSIQLATVDLHSGKFHCGILWHMPLPSWEAFPCEADT